MHTPVEFYLGVTPENLYRYGNNTSARLDHVRTCPPRDEEDSWEVKVKPGADGLLWVDHKSGGVSLFLKPIMAFGPKWWMLPKESDIPAGLTLSKDDSSHMLDANVHYTIRPVEDMTLDSFCALLRLMMAAAKPTFKTNFKERAS